MTKDLPVMNHLQPVRAAIYARVSSRKQKEEETINSQIDSLKRYAEENNYFLDPRHIFIDNGVSGTVLQRPALDELRDMIRFETIEAILVYAPDRLSRDYTHQLVLLEDFRKRGVKTIFLKNHHVDDNPEAKMLLHMQGIFAEYERAIFLDRSRRGRIYKAKQGDLSAIPRLPFGYQRVKLEGRTTAVIVEEEAIVVKEIYRLYIHEARSLNEVARKITESGIKPRMGGAKWDMSTIRDILKNPTYLGAAHYGKKEKCEGKSDRIRKHGSKVYSKAKYARKKRSEEEWIAISVPQIISHGDFEQAQVKLKKNKDLSRRNTKYPSLLQGLITCDLCGQPFYKRIRKNGDKSIGYYYCRGDGKRYKKCSNKPLRQHETDELVFNEVLHLLKTPALIEKEISRRIQEAANPDELTKREIISKKELAKLSYERDRLLDAYQSGVIDLKELKKRNFEVETRKINFEKDIHGLQVLKLRTKNIEFADLFAGILKKVENKTNELSFEEKRKLVRLLVDRVIVQKDTIHLIHCVSPASIALTDEECLLKADGCG